MHDRTPPGEERDDARQLLLVHIARIPLDCGGKMTGIALEINQLLFKILAKQGIVLVDFKIEFGRKKKTICLGDEISMDSMRLWDKKSGESLDKDVYRFEKGDVMAIYNQVAQRITKSGKK